MMAFAGAPAQAATGRLTLEVSGKPRAALIVERQRLKRALRPVYIVLRPPTAAVGPLRTRRLTGLEEAVKKPNVIFAYPEPLEGKWDTSAAATSRDVAFVNALAARLVADGVADPRRIFLVGRAAGGVVALQAACAGKQTFAGVAALLAALPQSALAECKPENIALMTLAGTADPLLPYNGGKAALAGFAGDVASADQTMEPFVKGAVCAEKKVIEMPDRDVNDGSRAFIDRWSCRKPVERVRIEGGGHVLPGRATGGLERGQPVGAHNRDVDATRLLLDFLKRAGG
jgi:polyhydroxybutyrate depolymerase